MKTLESRLEDYNAYLTLKNSSSNTKAMYLQTIRIFWTFRKASKIRGREQTLPKILSKEESYDLLSMHRHMKSVLSFLLNCQCMIGVMGPLNC